MGLSSMDHDRLLMMAKLTQMEADAPSSGTATTSAVTLAGSVHRNCNARPRSCGGKSNAGNERG